jgi:hypothetical protein
MNEAAESNQLGGQTQGSNNFGLPDFPETPHDKDMPF